MSFVPDWAPGAHPMLVHFPIAILFLAVLSETASLAYRKQPSLRAVTSGLYLLGAAAALIAFYTGREAANGAYLPSAANPVLSDHADWALRTVWYYSLLAVARLVCAWRAWDRRLIVHGVLLAVGAAGLALVVQTGDHGAEMVYRYGVGVRAVDTRRMEAHDHAAHEPPVSGRTAPAATTRADTEGHLHAHADENGHGEGQHAGTVEQAHPHQEHDHGADHAHAAHEDEPAGSKGAEKGWRWVADHDAEDTIRRRFRPLAGAWEALAVSVAHDDDQGDALALGLGEGIVAFQADPSAASVQVDARVNLDGFEGRFGLLHNISGSRSYGLLSVSRDGSVRLARVLGASTEVLEDGKADVAGWVDLRLVSDQGHFRGYVNGHLVVHGHGSRLAAGPAGFAQEGAGTVLLREFAVTGLR